MSSIRQAITLLYDENLVWSDDFESVRPQLARLLNKLWLTHQLNEETLELADAIVSSESFYETRVK